MRRFLPPVIGCLTLGLAPFTPEPHIVGKLRWVLGGAHGMRGLDWVDLALHGAPWVWLLATLVGWRALPDGEGVPARRVRSAVVAAVLLGAACALWNLRP